jgi:hypothetical protein
MYNDYNNNIITNTLPIVLLDNIRTDLDATISSLDITNKTLCKKTCDDLQDNKNINIYRYKFSDSIIQLLYTFSKIHQYDDRSTFKEAWNSLLDENQEIVDYEIRRLNNLEYEGDVKDKMFKSARYYFRKKNADKKEPKKRSTYISLNKELLEIIDHHIEVNVKLSNFKPSNGFDDFCNNHADPLKEEILRLQEKRIDNETIKNKIKKTYKNRYFMLLNANKNT